MPERNETWTPFPKHIPGGQIPRVKVLSCLRGFVNCTLGSSGSPGCSWEEFYLRLHSLTDIAFLEQSVHMNSLTSSAHPVLPSSSQPQGLAFLLSISLTARPLFLLFPPLATLFVLLLHQTPFCSCPFVLPHFLSCPCTLYSLFPVSRMSSFLPPALSSDYSSSEVQLNIASLENFPAAPPPPPQAETICTKVYLLLPTLGLELEVTCCSVVFFFFFLN